MGRLLTDKYPPKWSRLAVNRNTCETRSRAPTTTATKGTSSGRRDVPGRPARHGSATSVARRGFWQPPHGLRVRESALSGIGPAAGPTPRPYAISDSVRPGRCRRPASVRRKVMLRILERWDTPATAPAAHHWRARRWWAPWSFRCSCGIGWWPCPVITLTGMWVRPGDTPQVAVGRRTAPLPGRNGPTAALRPLLTPAQRWRGNGGRWWQS
jgi:hypothetical protein